MFKKSSRIFMLAGAEGGATEERALLLELPRHERIERGKDANIKNERTEVNLFTAFQPDNTAIAFAPLLNERAATLRRSRPVLGKWGASPTA